MKSSSLLFRSALLGAMASWGAVAQEPARPRLTAEDVITGPRVNDPQVSPDGALVLYQVGEPSLETNKVVNHLWLVPTEGGEPKRLTNGAGEAEGRWSPDGKRIAYVGRTSEGPQLFVMNADGTGADQVTKLFSGAGGPVWSPDGTRILFTAEVWTAAGDDAGQRAEAKARADAGTSAQIWDGLLYRHWSSFTEGKRSQLFAVDIAAKTVTQLTKEERNAPPFSLGGPPDYAWSKDGREVYYTRGAAREVEAWSTNADLCAVAADGSAKPRTLTELNLGYDGGPCVSPDGRRIVYRSQARDGYESDLFRLMMLDLDTGKTVRLGRELPDGVEEYFWKPNGDGLVVSIQEEGSHAWFDVAVKADSPPEKIWSGPNAFAASPLPNGESFVGVHASLVRPAELYRLRRGQNAPVRLTFHQREILERRTLPTRSGIVWDGARGEKAHGWLVLPPDFDAEKKYPLIVFIHGGPQGAWMDGWSTRWNPAIFASAGYVVFAPNPHGSTGYGHAYCEQISGDWGGAVFEDLQKGVDAVVAKGFVDPTRMGAAGGSYGGYMVNWFLGHDHRFKALVSHAGVYNLESMYGATEEVWFPEWEFKAPPWENRELYEKWSPHRFAAAFKTPTLVIHGELDYRVPVTQGYELFTALQRQGVPSRFLYFPDEGHWVLKPRNSRLWNKTVLDWFDSRLKAAR
jgi:dipeptidyl aminopeptidase/acylaminoacyl peptidase